jgi:hypothetical protein
MKMTLAQASEESSSLSNLVGPNSISGSSLEPIQKPAQVVQTYPSATAKSMTEINACLSCLP